MIVRTAADMRLFVSMNDMNYSLWMLFDIEMFKNVERWLESKTMSYCVK